MFGKYTISHLTRNVQQNLLPELGNNLVSIIRYGIHANSEPDQTVRTRGSLRLLIVVYQLDAQILERIGVAFQRVAGRHLISPMLMTTEELESSTDVFPITFLEMKRNYKLIEGIDVLDDLEIPPVHLRLRCEQELKNLILRMQGSYLTSRRPRMLKIAVSRNFESFLRAMGAALILVDRQPPADESKLCDLAADQFGLDREILTRVNQICSSSEIVDHELLTSLYAEFLAVVQQAAQRIDRLPEQVMLIDTVEDEEA